jgi:hypothetical protein
MSQVTSRNVMKNHGKHLALSLALIALWLVDASPTAPLGVVFVGEAEAVVGAPLTPISVAGVARRTTRRAVVATSSATAAQQQQAAAAPAPAPAPVGALPAGTVVSALPSGCVSTVMDGVNYFNCGGSYYQPMYQSNNLVYVVK